MKAITPKDVQTRLAEENAPLILDVRGTDEYAAGHVPGAVNIPMDEVEARLQEIPRDRPVVPYCNMQHPGLSRGERVTALLLGKGYEARVLDGSFLKWQEELPIAKDDN
ncbi:hypothetical protein BH24DEI1_BH24DEI1_17840 [soil metagenome]